MGRGKEAPTPLAVIDLVLLIPVLRRPHRVAPLLESIEANTPHPHRVLFLATEGDLEEHQAVRDAGAELLIVGPHASGDYARKINAGVRATTEALIFTGADDLLFHPGWLEAAVAYLDGTVGVVGTNDLSNRRVMRGDHSTHSLITRAYAELGTIDEPDKVLHEGYPHEYVDDELIGTARYRNAFAFAKRSHVEHLHPLYGKMPTDELYDQHARRMRQGRRVFDRRRHLWTPSTSPS